MVAGAVLTGGASRRMGHTKALVVVDGVAMGQRVATALAGGGCEPVVLVGGDPDELAPLGLALLPDALPGEGPLGGVLTALDALGGEQPVIVAACDLPALHAGTVARLLAAPSASVVVAAGARRHPTLARWAPAIAPALRTRFDAGERSLLGALASLEAAGHDVVELAVDEAELRNVNTPDDR